MSEPLLRMEHITKRFPGVLALDDVSLEIRPGETHGLLGENGAGKSTLLKILSGAYQPDAGSIMLGGKPLELKTPLDAQKHGIVTIYQEFNLVPYLGLVVSAVPGILISLLSGHILSSLIKLGIVFGVVQTLDGSVIGPRIVGDSEVMGAFTGLERVWVASGRI